MVFRGVQLVNMGNGVLEQWMAKSFCMDGCTCFF